MKVTIELDLPEGQPVPTAHDIMILTSPDWLIDAWHISDIQNEHDWLTDEQAREVLEIVGKRRDCNVGINWLMIEAIVDDYFPYPEEEEEA
jgi:hypothetical protein